MTDWRHRTWFRLSANAATLIRRRAARRGQQGYVLGVVLAAMVVGLTVITALLGLSFATHSAAISQQRLARERRAADGALEVGVEKLRASATPLADCVAVLEAVPMQLARSASETDLPVEVRCAEELDPLPMAGGLLVVGDSYDGGLKDAFSDPLRAPGSSTLLHEGDGPVLFVGDVQVRQGAMLKGSSLGAQVSGTYEQGAVGKTADGSDVGVGCGVLASAVPADAPYRLIDSDPSDGGDPACEVPWPPGLFTPPPAPTTTDGTVPASCDDPVGPGYFDASDLAVLNQLIATCDKVRFPAGDATVPNRYWFDAGDGGNLEFAGADVVFGTELAGSDPPVCDPGHDGRLEIVLGGATGVDHTEGAVTVCGGAGNPGNTILQTEQAAVQPKLTYVGSSPEGRWTDPQKANADEDLTPDPLDDPAQLVMCTADLGGCTPYPRLEYTVDSAGVGAINSIALEWKSHEFPPSFDVARQVWLYVDVNGDGEFTLDEACVRDPRRGRVADGMGTRIDLTSGLDGCGIKSGAKLDGDDLRDKRVAVEFRTFNDPFYRCSGDQCPWTAVIDDLRLVVNEVQPEPAGASSDGSWLTPENLVDLDSTTSSGSSLGCVPTGLPGICNRDSWDPASIPTAGFVLDATDEVLPDDQIGRLVVALDASTTDDLVSAPSSPGAGETSVSLDWGEGLGFEPCTDAGPLATYSRSKATQFLDVSGCADGKSLNDLQELDVQLEFVPEHKLYAGSVLQNWGVDLPRFSEVRVLATTTTVSYRPDVSVNVDSSTNAFLRIHGNGYLPSADLDVTWAGGGAGDDQSVVHGNLVIGAVGSKGESGAAVGVVCCGPEFPSMVLMAYPPEATLPRGVARVRLEQDVLGNSSAVISDWQLCNGIGCDVEYVTPGPPP